MTVEKFNQEDVASDNELNLTLSPFAAEKIKELLSDEEDKDILSLRVFITGGGCSGFKYGFTFEDEVAEDDFKLDMYDVSVVIDPMSYQYLRGALIDYEDNLMSSSFLIKNPQAKSTCGCGSSFSV